ncbi:hypothetical protein MMC27_005301 [Xylographa pallens]|nr:hypothetical protein [Xylographa pallens]
MAALLKPWLWPGIEKEVRQILSWKAGAPSASQPVEDAPPYEDDDSNLRIQSSQVPKLVQIIKFLTFDDPVLAVISDKTTSITATIASAAVEQFYRQHGKRVTENTRGCLIQLLQFEIVATHHGPPDDRLTLRIQEFKHIGCDGEGTYGTPRPIIKQDGIKQFLNELKMFRVRVSAKGAEVPDRDREGSLQSQENTSASEDRENEVVNSQLAFATQHGNRRSAKAPSRSALGRGQVQNPEVFVTTKDTSQQSSRISSEEVEQNIISMLKHAKEVERINSPPIAIAPSAKPQDCRAKPLNHSELLALLKKSGGNSISRPAVSKESAQRSMSNRSAVSPNHSKDHGSSDVQAGKPNEVASIIEQAGKSAQSTLSKSPLHHNAQEIATSEANQLDSPNKLPQNTSTNTAGLQSHAVVYQQVDRPGLPFPLAGAFCKADIDDPWYGLLHIKRRDVMIPKNQQILLDRRDCWLPPEPGSRGPVANIPVPILQTLTSSIEGHTNIASSTAVVHQDHSDCDSLSELAEIPRPQTNALDPPNCTHEDEDLPISTAEWPPSSPPTMPKVDQLPPDSSLEVTPVNKRKVGKQPLRTDDPETPSSYGRASVAMKRSISNFDAEVQVGFLGKSNPYVPPKRHKLQQRRERKGLCDADLNIDSESDFDDCHGTSSGIEAEVSSYRAQSRTDYLKTDDEVEHGYAEFNKSFYDHDDDLKISDEQRSLGKLLPVDSDEEVFSCLQSSHSQPRDTDHNGIFLDTTEQPTKLPEEVTIMKDIEIAYSSSTDLETSVPNALCEGKTTAHIKQQRSTPMDISDSRRSTLQVHRTPYTNQDHRIKTGILPRRLVAGKIAKRHHDVEEMTRHNNMSDDDAMTEDIIPGTYSHLNSAQKPFADHSRVSHTGDAERSAPVFHGHWVPYVSDEASARTRMKHGDHPVKGDIADPVRVSKRGTEESAIKSLNITKRRKRTKPSKVILKENDQQGGASATKSRKLHKEILENINAQSRTPAPIPNEVPDGTGNRILDAAPAEPVLPHSDHYNRGLSTSQGLCEAKTTCTQTPEATSSRSGTPRRDIHVTDLKRNSQLQDESASLVQNMPDRLSYDLVDRLIFSSFQRAYPIYQGNEKHFVAMCRKIQILETDHRMEHKSLWDDFIIRHQIEYRTYLHECSEQADDPMSYEKFYHAKIDEPQFSKRIITPNNLCEAISESLPNGGRMVASRETSNGESIGLMRDAHEPQETTRLRVTKASYMGTPDTSVRDISPVRRTLYAQHNPLLQRDSSLPHGSPSQRDSPPGAQFHPQRSTPTKPATRPSPILGTPRAAEKTPRSLPWKRKISDDPSPSGRNTKRRNVSNEATTSSEPLQAPASIFSPARNVTTSRRAYPATADPSKAGPAARPSPVQPWYLDPVNPFKSFARADASIRSGNGNAFADEKNQQRAEDAKAEIENGVVLTRMKKIDVLAWEL